jgi:type VII secretion integral membrane protein EccD
VAEPPAEASGRVRVTVVSGTRRADLALPGCLHVAELVPELARTLGLLDAGTVQGGYRLATLDGRSLATDAGLAGQGVEDGAVIVVSADVDDASPRRYDDVAEAMADVIERGHGRWDGPAGRRVAHGVALLLLLLGAGALLSRPGSGGAAIEAVGTALGLTSAVVWLSRVGGDSAVAVATAWTGCAYAAVAGLMLPADASRLGTPVAAAGAGVLVAGLGALLGLRERRTSMLPPVLVGAVVLTTGVVARASPADPAVVLAALVALVVVASSGVPRVALGASGTHADTPVHDVTGIDLARLRTDARLAHELVVAVSASIGLLLVLVAPVAVSLGPAGALVAVLSCGIVLLRSRHHVSLDEVLAGLVSGVLGLLSVALSVLWLQPGWLPVATVVLLTAGSALLATGPVSEGTAARIGRVADLLESTAVAALLPALVLASGADAALAG